MKKIASESDISLSLESRCRRRPTRFRKVFLRALKVIQSEFTEEKMEAIGFVPAAMRLFALIDGVPKDDELKTAWAICAALWATEYKDCVDAKDVHEECIGAEMYMMAYQMGRFSVISQRKKKAK